MNILVVKNRALGDSVIGLSAIQYIRELFPQAHIIYGVPSWIAPLYGNIKTAADEVMPLDLNSLGDWTRLWRELSRRKVDTVHELFQSGRTAKFFKIYCLLKNVQYTYHNHHLKSGGVVHDQGVIKPAIQRDLDGVYSHLTKRVEYPSYLDYQPSIGLSEPQDSKRPREAYIILGVVATRETKTWPLSYFVELTKLILQNFPDLTIKIPLSRSQVDERIKEKLRGPGLSKKIEFVQVPLPELAALIGGSKLYVGNDTGLKHLAVATGVRSFTLFGPEPPHEWHPYDSDRHPYFYREGLECRTRTAHYCGLIHCDSMICLNEFSSRQVFDRIGHDLKAICGEKSPL